MHNFLGRKAAKVNVRTERGQASRDSPLVPALPEHRCAPGWPASRRDGFGPERVSVLLVDEGEDEAASSEGNLCPHAPPHASAQTRARSLAEEARWLTMGR